jgi:DNA polymerase I-like protein with 3'-5' exonuclease and polymerase domains
MSCSSSSFWCGTQVQNIPSYAKNILVADEGYTLIEFDNSQSEARCTAYLAKETHLIAALEDKERDFYTSLGTLFFQIPYEQVTKDFRNKILKKIVHGTNYMMGAATFIENAGTQNLITGAAPLGLKITLSKTPKSDEISLKAFATSLLESYHKPFPRVREWYKEIQTDIATTKMLRSPLGWTRYFFGDITKDHNMLRGAVAHAPQNLSVQILNIGLWKIWQLVKASQGKIRFKAQIHDSIFLQVHDSILEEAKQKVDKLREEAASKKSGQSYPNTKKYYVSPESIVSNFAENPLLDTKFDSLTQILAFGGEKKKKTKAAK